VDDGGSGKSEPYLWPVFLWADGGTLARAATGGDPVESLASLLGLSARDRLGGGFQNGTVVAVPPELGSHTALLDDDPRRGMGVAVGVLERDETPDSAARAGHAAFAAQVPQRVNEFVRREARLPSEGEMAPIGDALQVATDQAMRDAQSWWSRLTNDQDDVLGVAFRWLDAAGLERGSRRRWRSFAGATSTKSPSASPSPRRRNPIRALRSPPRSSRRAPPSTRSTPRSGRCRISSGSPRRPTSRGCAT
jgi:hypothetical protein